MDKLGIPKNTIEILNKYGFVLQKKYGQNFLIDTHVLEKIIKAADITEKDFVLEIGPGIGTLTQYLCENAGKVVAVEIDKNLIPILNETLSPYKNVTIMNEDILKVDIASLVKTYNESKPIKVVANLPYYITTPIIMGLFENHVPLAGVTVMIQKEVAERIKALPGSKDYGALSLAVQFYARPYIVAYVPPNCFLPRPKVGSAVVNLTPYDNSPYFVRDEKLLFTLIRAAFNQRRKTLVNAVTNFEGLPYDKNTISEILDLLGLPKDIRGEALSLEQFINIANRLSE